MLQDNADQVLISAMTSLVVSSSSRTPALPIPAFPISSFASPGRRRKFYVVSVGKRTGVFDNWSVLPLVFLIAMIYLFL
jgi:hypothetical protein